MTVFDYKNNAGDYKLRVVIIEPAYPNGLVLTDELLVTVVGAP